MKKRTFGVFSAAKINKYLKGALKWKRFRLDKTY